MFVRRFGGGGGDAPGGAAAAVPNAAAQAPSSLYLGRAASLGRPSKMFRRRTHLSMEVIANNPVRNSRVYGRQSDEGKTDKSVPDMNEEILESGVESVRCVISIKGLDEQLGIMSTEAALKRAQEEGLDLVMISQEADPPVVKIIDYGKFKYKQNQRKKDNKAKQKATELKEVKMSYKIETHDYDVRLKNANKFIMQGNRVRVVVQFRGREQSHMDLGNVLLDRVSNDLKGIALMEPKRREGNRLSMIVYPKPTT
ncbi:unnamed protein product [Ascophyllum nodosum]